MPLLSLGWFAFSIATTPFDSLKRTTSQRWERKNRIGRRAAAQNNGPGDDTITLPCSVVPGVTGAIANLDKLREMMAGGKVWNLVAGTGDVLGKWYITQIDEDHQHLLKNGVPRKLDFTLTLQHYDDDDAAPLGDLRDSLP